MSPHFAVPILLAAASLALMTGCGVTAADAERTSTRADAIIGGKRADGYEEALLVHGFRTGSPESGICSGALIAPRVAITAGHCVDGMDSWQVIAPYGADTQSASSSRGVTYDYDGWGQQNLTPALHDVGLLLLDTRIELPVYPTLATAPLAGGSEVVQIGRIRDGIPSMSNLFVSPPITVQDGAEVGFPYDYSTWPNEGQPGDSGGPSVVAGPSPRELVAVTSGDALVARVDLVHAWIEAQIAAHEAAGAGGAGGGGAGGETGSTTTRRPVRDAAPAATDVDAGASPDTAPDLASVSCTASPRAIGEGSAAPSLAVLGALAVAARRRRARRLA